MSKKKHHQPKETKMAIIENNASSEEIVEQAIKDAELQETSVVVEVPVMEEVVETPVIEEPVIETPVVEEVVETPVIEEPVVEAPVVQKAHEDDFAVSISIFRETGTVRQKYLIENIESYIEKMLPGKPVTFDQGAKHQFALWKLISNIAEKSSNEEFNKLWSILLAYFKEYEKTVFADRYIYRFSESWIWSQGDLAALQRIINLIKLTCDSQKRAVNLSKVDINRSLAESFSDDARQRIISFYRR